MTRRGRLALTAVLIVLSILAIGALLAHAQNRYGCGLRGGTGLRATDGHCVGWDEVARVCGEPPFTGKCVEDDGPGEPPPCSGCGCKGGPGYRAPDGRCVGWKALRRLCGDPPTTACTPEGPALEAVKKAR